MSQKILLFLKPIKISFIKNINSKNQKKKQDHDIGKMNLEFT
jgi:hypothetical protein